MYGELYLRPQPQTSSNSTSQQRRKLQQTSMPLIADCMAQSVIASAKQVLTMWQATTTCLCVHKTCLLHHGGLSAYATCNMCSTSACCACQGQLQLANDIDAGTSNDISQYTSLNSTADVDTRDDDASHFGLHVYGSGAPTGVVIDSGDEQVGYQCCACSLSRSGTSVTSFT